MFETVELGKKISKREYKQRVKELRSQLLVAQIRLRKLKIPVVVVFGGIDGAGKSEAANLLNEWMDPRWIQTHAYDKPTEDEAERPEFWRFWRDLPGQGQVGVFLSAWYSNPLVDHAYGGDDGLFDQRLSRIAEFERMLAEDGAIVIKFWMHLGKAALEARLKSLEDDPLQSWRVSDVDWRNFEHYDDFLASAEHLIMRTSTGRAPWHLVEGSEGHRSLMAGSLLLNALNRRIVEREKELMAEQAIADKLLSLEELERQALKQLKKNEKSKSKKKKKKRSDNSPAGSSSVIGSSALQVPGPHAVTILQKMDLSKKLPKPEYRRRLAQAQAELGSLQIRAKQQQRSVVCAFEGVDAAGKGGAIRRTTGALSSKNYKVIPVAAPTDEELAHHYLWRFWRQIPRDGRVTIFDRTWYGRVLVERVEGFATKAEWRRAYNEINHFEQQLTDHGVILLKFWLQISPEEQLRRFDERALIEHKKWKLTDEDWRNRKRWPLYENAVHDMVERTSTRLARWHLIEGEDKYWARVKVIETVCEALRNALD